MFLGFLRLLIGKTFCPMKRLEAPSDSSFASSFFCQPKHAKPKIPASIDVSNGLLTCLDFEFPEMSRARIDFGSRDAFGLDRCAWEMDRWRDGDARKPWHECLV